MIVAFLQPNVRVVLFAAGKTCERTVGDRNNLDGSGNRDARRIENVPPKEDDERMLTDLVVFNQ